MSPPTDSGPSEGPETDERAERLAHLLDSLFRVPGTEFRVGLDAVFGLLPGVGDATSAALALYVVTEAYRAGVPRATLVRMLLNVGIDVTIGAIPLVGDLFDLVWKSNERNVALMRERSIDPAGAKRDRFMVVGLGVTLVALVFAVVTVIGMLVQEIVALIPV